MPDSPPNRWMQGNPDPFGDAAAFHRSIGGRVGRMQKEAVERGEAIIRDEHGREVKRVPYSTLVSSGGLIWSNTGEDVSLRNGWSIEFPATTMKIT